MSAEERLLKPIEGNGVKFESSLEILRFDPERMMRIAGIMVDTSLKIKEQDRLLLRFHPGGSQLAQMIGYLAAERGAAVLPRCEDALVEAAILAGISHHETPQIMNDITLGASQDIAWATKVAFVRSKDFPHANDIVPADTQKAYNQSLDPSLRIRVERRPWTLIYIPTRAEAQIDQMTYEDYVGMFLRGCDRPWEQVNGGQDILINDYLNPGKELELFAGQNTSGEWQTHLWMSIEGMTFANSTIDFNIPGSEVFSSPKRGTVNGRLNIPYPVNFAGRVLPNIGLLFENGRIIQHSVDSNIPEHYGWVKTQLATDEGAREIGEIALGTNRVFNRPLLNGLYVEKVGGSFHITPGCAYSYKEYAGKPVNLDNGVRSAIHEDLTCMMLPEYGGGKVVVDGEVIQENGQFLDPRLEILNET